MVKAISATTHVLQAAGISTPKDVTKAIRSGADGTGGTSGIVCADEPKAVLLTMLQAMKEGMQ
jgi:triosephosphate isomerase